MNRRRFLSMLGAIPAALALGGVTPSPVEMMTRDHFWSLTERERATWERRLRWQWNLALSDARGFWFVGSTITGVEVFKLNSEGRKYAIANEVATEILGRAS